MFFLFKNNSNRDHYLNSLKLYIIFADTRISSSDADLFEDVSDQMGVTWLIAEMLRRPRMQPVRLYLRLQDDHQLGRTNNNNAQSTTDSRDLTGLGLQYCHARLCRYVLSYQQYDGIKSHFEINLFSDIP